MLSQEWSEKEWSFKIITEILIVLKKFGKLKIITLKMTTKLQDPKTDAKMYWAILSRQFYNKENPAILSWLVNGKLVSDFCEKANLLINFFASICTPIKTQANYQYFHIGPMPK